MGDHDLVTKLSVIQVINRLGLPDMGLVNVDAVKKAVRELPPVTGACPLPLPPTMACSGCFKDGGQDRDTVCRICLRYGHETDIDFYRNPQEGGGDSCGKK